MRVREIMSNHKRYEFEASLNSQGEFECFRHTEINSEREENNSSKERSHSRRNASDDGRTEQQSYHYSSTSGHNTRTDSADPFAQRYQTIFTQSNADYIESMRTKFSQMRQSMLDQMESYTHIRNVRR